MSMLRAAVRQSAAALAEPTAGARSCLPACIRLRTIDRTVDREAASPRVTRVVTPADDHRLARAGAGARLGEIRRRLSQNEAGTYIGDILAARDSNIARWPDRTSRPLRVWIQSADSAHDWNPAYPDQVRDAFTTWVSGRRAGAVHVRRRLGRRPTST